MKNLNFFTYALILFLFSYNSNAQSVFEGFYVQLGVGLENDDLSYTGGEITSRNNIAYFLQVDDKSRYFSANVSLGWYYSMSPNFLIGIGADYLPLNGVETSYNLVVPEDNFVISASYMKKSAYNIFISPAYVVAEDKLLYLKAGYSNITLASEFGSTSETASYGGYSFGFGYRQLLGSAIFGFVEANFSSYSSRDDGGAFTGTHSPENHSLHLGLGYKF